MGFCPREERGDLFPLENPEPGFWHFLTENFRLSQAEQAALLLAYTLETRPEKESPWPTPGMLAQMGGLSYPELRALFHPREKLRRFRMVRFPEEFSAYPFLERPYRLPEPLLDRLSGIQPFIPALMEISPAQGGPELPFTSELAEFVDQRLRSQGSLILELVGPREAGLLAAEELLGRLGLEGWLWLEENPSEEGLGEVLREALFEGRALVLEGKEGLRPLRALLEDLGFLVLILSPYPLEISVHLFLVDHPPRSYLEELFRSYGFRQGPFFSISRGELRRWAADGKALKLKHLERLRERAGKLARVKFPERSLEDLILPDKEKVLLEELLERLRLRERWPETPALRSLLSARRGINALFAGPSGTGKTLAAEALARALGLPLVVVDLAMLVSHWVGETEKHLRHLFEEVVSPEAVVVFDEAEALFGRRVETRQAQDRYANLEVSYLLQCLEQHQGLVILTTNLEPGLDEAFWRRLDVVIRFPFPDEETRLLLWRKFLEGLPHRGLDPAELAARFRLSGGQIRNVILTAFGLAGGGTLGPAEVERALEIEILKIGAMLEEA